MILIDRRAWLRQLLLIRGTSLVWTWKRVSLATGVATIATVLHQLHGGSSAIDLSPLPFTLIGLALSIFLGFRNNTSYDRFWEGRKLWGSLVNVARSFTRQLLTLVGPRMVDANCDHRAGVGEAAEMQAVRHALVHALIAYVHALRHHLRDEDGLEQLHGLLPPELLASLASEHNRPVAITQWIGDQLRGLYDRGWIHAHHLTVLEASLTEITAVQGACERIKSTPIPASYTVLIHRIVVLYCVGLPFGILSTVGTMTPVVVAIVAYAFYGLDAVGTEIEDPFGLDPNDLPLSALSRMIEVNLRQRLGEQELPPLLEPVDGILQ
ncbi:bestrophin family protein [Enhygromyxa salina]|uniref:Bestrophin, RFP-TM, chloride channel n=1 Tax=Enhygromyxa salina TaxID=215803 RepID=A0A2S9YR98_9BACT|nr:bestrophin family ion channel [Enhygromyxa salina]PRQ07621.1 Bestrophin, RFP-TM, chloride channel [Enhygromyxa salina]